MCVCVCISECVCVLVSVPDAFVCDSLHHSVFLSRDLVGHLRDNAAFERQLSQLKVRAVCTVHVFGTIIITWCCCLSASCRLG